MYPSFSRQLAFFFLSSTSLQSLPLFLLNRCHCFNCDQSEQKLVSLFHFLKMIKVGLFVSIYKWIYLAFLIQGRLKSSEPPLEWKGELRKFCCSNTIPSSSCRAASTDIPDPLLPPLPIIHRFWQVFRATSRILT